MAVGPGAQGNGDSSIAIGNTAKAGDTIVPNISDAVSIGHLARVVANQGIAIGSHATVDITHVSSMAFGVNATTTRATQVVFSPVTDFIVNTPGTVLVRI